MKNTVFKPNHYFLSLTYKYKKNRENNFGSLSANRHCLHSSTGVNIEKLNLFIKFNSTNLIPKLKRGYRWGKCEKSTAVGSASIEIMLGNNSKDSADAK